jgi:hypothetical protein
MDTASLFSYQYILRDVEQPSPFRNRTVSYCVCRLLSLFQPMMEVHQRRSDDDYGDEQEKQMLEKMQS